MQQQQHQQLCIEIGILPWVGAAVAAENYLASFQRPVYISLSRQRQHWLQKQQQQRHRVVTRRQPGVVEARNQLAVGSKPVVCCRAVAACIVCRDYLVEYNDTMATLLLAGVTQSLAGLNELTDKFGVAYEKSGRKGRGGGGGGSMMAVGMYGL